MQNKLISNNLRIAQNGFTFLLSPISLPNIAAPMHPIDGVKFESTSINTIKTARALEPGKKSAIEWDRFMRLNATAELIRKHLPNHAHSRILDLNGWDGALSLFVPDYHVDILVDDIVYGTNTDVPVDNQSYNMVTSIGDLEHISQQKRAKFIEEIARIAKEYCLIGFPNPDSLPAQKLVYGLTSNSDIKEHIDYGLPDIDWVKRELEKYSFACEVILCTSLALWAVQFVLDNIAPKQAARVSKYLVEHHLNEPFRQSLYSIVIGRLIK